MNERNYQKELEAIIDNKDNFGKRLLLHSCCAPCSSYVLCYLSTFFDITVFYYNPNITDENEYDHRIKEQKRLIDTLNTDGYVPEWAACRGDRINIKLIEGDRDVDAFYAMSRGLEKVPEGGSRCEGCFGLRLQKTWELARKEGFDLFGTTLTISPMKNAKLINSVGERIAKNGDNAPMWMPSDFKKKDGYRHSIELSAKYDLYRQNYCGCEFSVNNR